MSTGLLFLILSLISGLFLSAAFIVRVLGEKRQAVEILRNWLLFLACWAVFGLVLGAAYLCFNFVF